MNQSMMGSSFHSPTMELERLRREVERLRCVAGTERGLLDAILRTSPHGISVCDADGKLILQNEAAERIWAGSATASNVEGWGQYRAYPREAPRGAVVMKKPINLRRLVDSVRAEC